ncbi:MAG: hypothetical protein HQL52_06660 [Magnetococcales bacterium]|nr:hypothetical protein [Magnetococcales bacterium]
MCTVFYLKNQGLLSKNRDKEQPETEEIVATPEMLGVRTVGADYLSLGLNRHGCAFVTTAVNSPTWTAAVEAGELPKARELMARDIQGKSGISHLLSRLLPQVRSIDDWLAAIEKTKTPWRGYNAILVDRNRGVHVEVHAADHHPSPMGERYIVTNHFRHLSWGPRHRPDYPNSWERFDYAGEKIQGITSQEGLFQAIAPASPQDRERIWRQDTFQTISSTVVDLKALCLYRTFGPGEPFDKIPLPG